MNWKRFSLVNNVLGWGVFLISAVVYLLTIEPTASLWDCAEFIACDYRLEVGHPPGAPFYMLVYNVMTHLAPDATQAALYANATSAVISALTILFLFWTLTHILRRLVVPEFRRPGGSARLEPVSLTMGQSIAIFGAAVVGSLVYTFSDTFWFSAVEAEVYAFSSLFTAVVFWLMFQWDERSERLGADRWIVLIAYLMGLSIGVHLLNLLCLPAMALIYYYRKSSLPTLRGSLYALMLSFVLIAVMMYGIVQGVPKMAGRFDLLFVNTLGFGFNTGLYFYLALTLLTLGWSVYEAHSAVQRGDAGVGKRLQIALIASVGLMGIPFLGDGFVLGLILLAGIATGLYYFRARINVRFVHVMQMSLLAIAIGFSSYGVILVRAIADTPMNENAPANAFSLRYYLAREQYGSAPLIYGPSFTAQPIGIEDGKEVMGKAPKASPNDPDRYTKLYDQPEYQYNDADKMLFPRVYSRAHAQSYNGWMGRRSDDMTPPSFVDNLYYFFNYQVNYMYWRYFMWNFVGRQNDLPGQGELMKGNAITGISFIDELLVGPQDAMPDALTSNKGRNVYYALPLLLGLLGMYYQVSRGEKKVVSRDGKTAIPVGHQSFWIVFFLFFMTGLAIVLYLNQTPGQPRERDYAYAGSFYAFAIWIGIGVIGLWRLISRAKLSETTTAVVSVALALLIPLQMMSQNWDDHDRSGRTIARDMGINYLESVEPNAILFCYGDNDTFPLWYIQDVEGVRTDVRTVNLSYLGGDWYIDQMRRRTYEGAPLPMRHMSPEFYYFHEAVYIDQKGERMDVDRALSALPEQAKAKDAVLPSGSLFLPVDSASVASRLTDPDLQGRVLTELPMTLQRRVVDRGTATVLDFISANGWERPVYWTSTSPRDVFAELSNHQLLTGMAYQLLPVDLGETLGADSTVVRSAHSRVRVEQMYDAVMNKFRWGGADNPNVYFDETARNMMNGVRSVVFPSLANALMDQGDMTRARAVLAKALESIRPEVVPYDYYSLRLVQSLYRAEMTAEADHIALDIVGSSVRSIEWMLRLSESKLRRVMAEGELYNQFDTAIMAYQISTKAGSKALAGYESKLLEYNRMLGGQN